MPLPDYDPSPPKLQVPRDRGAFLSFLEWLGSTGDATRNLIGGRPGAAGRKAADFLLDIPDAFIPGDAFSKVSTDEDRLDTSDLVGGMEPGVGRAALNAIGNTALDPLTYVPGAAVVKGLRGAKAKTLSAVDALPSSMKDPLKAATVKTKAALGYLSPSKEMEPALQEAATVASNVRRASLPEVEKLLKGMPDSARGGDVKALFEGVVRGEDGVYAPVGPQAKSPFVTAEEQKQLLVDRALAMPWDGERRAAAVDAAIQVMGRTRGDWVESIKDFPIYQQPKMYKGADGTLTEKDTLLDQFLTDQARIDKNAAAVKAESDRLRAAINAKKAEVRALLPVKGESRKAAERIPRLEKAQEELTDQLDDLEHFMAGVEDKPDFQAWVKGRGYEMTDLDPNVYAPADYVPRGYRAQGETPDVPFAGEASALKGRVIGRGEDYARFLNETGAEPIDDLAELLPKYAADKATSAGRASIGRAILGDDFRALTDSKSRKGVNAILEKMSVEDPETFKLLSVAWKGMPGRHPVMQVLANANHVFKPAAVYGLVFPRVGGIVKNILGFPFQAGMSIGGKQAARQVARTPQAIYAAFRAGVGKAFGWTLPADRIDRAGELIEAAFAQSRGRASNASAWLRANGSPELASAVDMGVVDGFVSREAVEESIRNSSWGRRLMAAIGLKGRGADRAYDLIDAPAASFQGAEQHGRLGTYLDLLADGVKPDEAAKQVRSAFYDYTTMAPENRTLRTLIPFAAFSTNAIKQTSGFLAKNPWAAVAAGNVLVDDEQDPIYPHMAGKTAIPLGRDQRGDRQYLSGIPSPVEAMNLIPGSFRDIRQDIIGSSQPLVKSAFAAISGVDPFFGTPYGEYDKLPLYGNAGKVGKAYNAIAGTGLIQPVSTPLQFLDTLFDDRKGLPEKAAKLGAGLNVVSVEETRARELALRDAIANSGETKTFSNHLAVEGASQSTLDMLKELEAIRRQRKKAASD